MKANIINHAIMWVCLVVPAQAQESASGGSLAGRFKQLDRSGDGKLSREEAGSAPFFNAADRDGDGLVTFAEAEAHARKSAARNRTAGMEGDGAGPMTSRVKPVQIPETESPIQTLDTKAADGRDVRAFWRKPKGDGPFPAVVFIHGGLTQFPEEALRRQLAVNPVVTRMLAAGYAVVQATFRTYEQDVQSRGPIEDVRAVVHALAKAPGVDAKRIALFGGSGGGSIALELGGDPAVRAIVAGEPATVLYTGMLTTGEYGPRLEIMAAPEKYLTPELRRHTLEKLKTLCAPVLILHGDRHDLHKLNAPLFVPLMKEAGVKVEYREYAGYGHGFYFGGGDDRWGKGADDRVVADVVRDVRAFLDRSMPAAESPAVFQPLDANGDGMPNREEREPVPPQAGERLTPLDRHRLCLVRDEALKRLNAKGVAKLVEIGDQLRSVPRWTAAHTGEVRLLLDQMEARYGLSTPDSVPADALPEATVFAVPRREWRDVRFAESPGVDAREQSLDVYAPATGEGHPIVIFIHGGGMKAGDKAHPGVTVLKPDFFVACGFVFVSANYRLAPRHVHPAQTEDTAAALAWVHDHAAKYGGDPGKLFVIGVSAGAHLAAVVATNERFLAAHGKSPAIIAGAVILDIGSFDIPTLMERDGARAPDMYRYSRAGVTSEAAGLAARRPRTRPETDEKEGHHETQ